MLKAEGSKLKAEQNIILNVMSKKWKRWKYTLARDIVALGGIPFLVITIVRVSTGPSYYPVQLIISSLTFFTLRFLCRGSLHAGVGMILFSLISIYYGSWLFFAYATLLYILLIISLLYLRNSIKEVAKGVLLGIISSLAGYIFGLLLFIS